MLLETNGVKILIDPGAWSEGQNSITGIDLVLITHEHQDHFHVESVKQILANNPEVKIITNMSVSKLLLDSGIASEILDDDKAADFKGVLIEAFGKTHAEIYKEVPSVENTGYFINNEFYYPGDAFYDPGRPVKILALPVCGPWMLVREAIEFALKVKPEVCFPVHDGMLKIFGPFHLLPKKFLEKEGVKFEILEIEKEIEF